MLHDHSTHTVFLVKLFPFLEQITNVPTRNQNILDLIFTPSDFIDSVSVQKTAISDHNIIYVQTNLQVETDNLSLVTSGRPVKKTCKS